ncbi:hypothetical protein PR048_006407 [Dryococelus australis]|uniref:SPIN-DOC-like zinc-finger domain-containing protein n=1 Tax=Dryococelus australis TaxID=614101 RepID=A0ABQ9IAZ2_9NEOP|nr:hypothetical protein PR048_006407 [Dryococelus australis]
MGAHFGSQIMSHVSDYALSEIRPAASKRIVFIAYASDPNRYPHINKAFTIASHLYRLVYHLHLQLLEVCGLVCMQHTVSAFKRKMPLSKYSNCKKRTTESDDHVFQERWELAYFCCESRGKITCLICSQSISVAKEYNLRGHYETHHHKYDQYQEKSREDNVWDLKTALVVFKNSKGDGEASVRVSYAIAELIALNCKCYSDSEFVKQCLMKTVEIVCPEKVQNFKNIFLSRNTIAERVDILLVKDESFVAFSIAVDESTDVSDKAQLLGIVSFQNTTTGENIFEEVYRLLKWFNLLLSKLVCVATDGAPSMTGKHNRFVARLLAKQKEVSPESMLHHIHCTIYQEVLCSKIVQMEHVLKYVKKVANFIHSRDLNQHQKKSAAISVYDHIKAFKLKLNFWEGQLNGGNLIYFPICQDFRKSHSATDFTQYTFNTNEQINEFKSRFEDFKMPENDFSLFSDSFSFLVQMELIDLQCDNVLKNKFNEIEIPKFYSYLSSQCSEMHQFSARILAIFGSTYLCDKLFSLMKANKNSHPPRLQHNIYPPS